MRASLLVIVFLTAILFIECLNVNGQALNVPANFPKYKVIENNSPDEGYYFLAAVQMPDKQPGYLIMLDSYGTPVYYRYFNKVLNSFGVQKNKLLSFMGRSSTGAQFFIMDSTFKIIDSVKTKAPYLKTDPHDFRVLENGHYVFLANDPRVTDMTAYGGKSNATVTGCVIQEQDENKNVVFNWSTWDHFQITDSYADLTVSQVDLIHHNSIDVDENGNFLLSSRSLNEITKIDRTTGNIIWRLGGKNNQFTFTDPASMFSMGHDFRKLPNGHFTFFDNGNGRNPAYSRSLEYTIDETAKTVDLFWSYDADKKIYADNSGSTTKLETGGTVLGFGYGVSKPAIIEAHTDGSVAFRLDLPDNIASYRAYKSPWRNKLFVPGTYSIDYGMWDGYTSSSYLLQISNKTNQIVTLTSYSTHTTAFTIEESFPMDIPANGQITLTVDFYPGSINTGYIKDILTINSDINTSSLVQRVAQQVQLTGRKTDVTPPVVTFPQANKTNVPQDTVITINLSEPVRFANNTEFNYTNIDQLIVFKKDNSSGENVPFDAVISSDKNIISVKPTAILKHTQKYYIAISTGFEDYSNNAGIVASATFTTIDLTSPVATITPANNTTFSLDNTPIRIQFNEPVRNVNNSELINSDLASILSLKLTDATGANVTFVATINAEKTIISIVPDLLNPFTTYYVAIAGAVEDNNNNLSVLTSSTFTTGGATEVESITSRNIRVYPNPGNGLFAVESDKIIKKIKVTDMNGKTLLEKNNLSDYSGQIDLRNFSDGIYLLYIEESGLDSIHAFKLLKRNVDK